MNWVHSHRDQLGITTITVAGESGGGNLALATALKAKQDRRLHVIDGVYAMVPLISGAYGWSEADRARELPSLVENDSYFMSCATGAIIASVSVTGRKVLGVCHAADLMFRRAMPDMYAATVNDLHRFAASC